MTDEYVLVNRANHFPLSGASTRVTKDAPWGEQVFTRAEADRLAANLARWELRVIHLEDARMILQLNEL